MMTGIFILLYSVAILVDSSMCTKPHLPRYAYISYHAKTEIFPNHYLTFIIHIYLFIHVLKLPLIDWMVQRTSLMKLMKP